MVFGSMARTVSYRLFTISTKRAAYWKQVLTRMAMFSSVALTRCLHASSAHEGVIHGADGPAALSTTGGSIFAGSSARPLPLCSAADPHGLGAFWVNSRIGRKTTPSSAFRQSARPWSLKTLLKQGE